VRDGLEVAEGLRIATAILRRLPRDPADLETLSKEGYRLARDMSWDGVVRKHLLNDLTRKSERPLARESYSGA